MGIDPINSSGSVIYGAAVPVEVESYTKDILAGMRQKQAQEDEAMKDALRQKRHREEKLNKYKNDLSRWQLTQEKGIWKGRTPEVKALAEDMFRTMQEGLKDSPNTYDPESDKKLFEAEQNFSRATDEWQQENKMIQAHMATALDPKKRDMFDVSDDFLAAYQIGDPEKLRKAISKGVYGDESRSGEINTYSGVGFLKPIDTADWNAQTKLAASKEMVPVRDVDLGNGKYKKTQQLTPEEKEARFQTWMTGQGGKLHRSMMSQIQSNNPYYPEEKGIEELRKTFVGGIKDVVDLSGGGGQGPRSYEEKNAEKFKFTAPELYKRPSSGDFMLSTINKIGGGALSSDFYSNNNSQSVLGRPTGRIKKYEKGGKVVLEIAVPNVKSLSMPPDWGTMDEQAKTEWTNQQYEKDPNKFTLEEIPLAGANKDKFEASFGKSVEDVFSDAKTSTEKSTPKKETAADKSVTKQKIKSLVGTKGFEGYSEKELIDYYTSQGYSVK